MKYDAIFEVSGVASEKCDRRNGLCDRRNDFFRHCKTSTNKCGRIFGFLGMF